MLAKMTLIGMSNYMEKVEKDLFEFLTVPDGIDKDILVENILLQGGEFPCMYMDPDFMRYAIGIWSRKNQRVFTKWLNALSIEYNPLDNYDRSENWTTTNTGTVGNTGTIGNSGTSNETIDNKISAFNSDTLKNDTQTVDGLSTTSTQTNNLTRTDNLTETHTGRIRGNIGVTTSMELLEKELDISRWNIYEQITDLFTNEFCIKIY